MKDSAFNLSEWHLGVLRDIIMLFQVDLELMDLFCVQERVRYLGGFPN